MVDTDTKAEPLLPEPPIPAQVSRDVVVKLGKDEKAKLRKKTRYDRFLYITGIANVMATAFVLGRCPDSFWIVQVVKTCVYLPWRFVRFSAWKGQLWLLEWCYAVNVYTSLGCLLMYWMRGADYWSALLIKAGFALSNGAVGWSVIIFRNSLVFHDPDHMTSVFIHLSPSLLFWCLRWGGGHGHSRTEASFPGMFSICPGDQMTGAQEVLAWWTWDCTATWWELCVIPVLLYLIVWAIPYYVLFFIVLPPYVKKHGLSTMYDWTVYDDKGQTKKCFVTKFPPKFWHLSYMLQHAMFLTVAGTLSHPMWHSFWIHTAYLLFLLLMATQNGASFTFEVFATRYTNEMVARHPSLLDGPG